jgi:hypothetical protein
MISRRWHERYNHFNEEGVSGAGSRDIVCAEIVYDLVTYVPASPRMHLMPDVLKVNGYLGGLRTHIRGRSSWDLPPSSLTLAYSHCEFSPPLRLFPDTLCERPRCPPIIYRNRLHWSVSKTMRELASL